MTNLKKVVTGLVASVVAFSLPGLVYATITVGSASVTTDSTLSLQGGNVGVGTTAPGKALEINSATGANLRLTYNDADGAAASYGDFSVSSGGDLTVAPSGGDFNITGNGAVSGTLGVTGNSTFTGLIGVGGSAIDPTVYVNLVNTGAYGGDSVTRYGYSADLTATDLSNVTAGYFSAGSSYGVSAADHNVLTGLDVHTNFSGTGRVDNSQGVYIQVANSNTGNMKDAYGIYNQILGVSGQTTGSAIGYYGDLVTTSSGGPIASASLFLGKIRKLGGTSGFGTIYGIQLSGWEPGADTDGGVGAPYDYAINTSYGIYMDNSIDVGDTRYAIYSSSTSDSYLNGDLGLGTTDPTGKLDVNANNIRIRSSQSPLSDAACNTGEMAWDASYIYVCAASGDWRRSALTADY